MSIFHQLEQLVGPHDPGRPPAGLDLVHDVADALLAADALEALQSESTP